MNFVDKSGEIRMRPPHGIPQISLGICGTSIRIGVCENRFLVVMELCIIEQFFIVKDVVFDGIQHHNVFLVVG